MQGQQKNVNVFLQCLKDLSVYEFDRTAQIQMYCDCSFRKYSDPDKENALLMHNEGSFYLSNQFSTFRPSPSLQCHRTPAEALISDQSISVAFHTREREEQAQHQSTAVIHKNSTVTLYWVNIMYMLYMNMYSCITHVCILSNQFCIHSALILRLPGKWKTNVKNCKWNSISYNKMTSVTSSALAKSLQKTSGPVLV